MKRTALSVGAVIALVPLFAAGPTIAVADASLSSEQRAEASWASERWLQRGEVEASGLSGEGIKIAVIDDAINLNVPELRGADVKVQGTTCLDPESGEPAQVESTDPVVASHGTNVVATIVGNGHAADGGAGTKGVAQGAEVLFYGVGDIDRVKNCKLQDPTTPKDGVDLSTDVQLGLHPEVRNNPQGLGDATALAARAAIRDGADIVTVSVVSGIIEWRQVLVEAQLAGVVVVAATPNPGEDIDIFGGPADVNGALPVSAINQAGELLDDESTGATVGGSRMLGVAAPGENLLGVGSQDNWGPSQISGTSFATPLVAGVLALGMEKFPDATGFQIMQALIHTTGNGKVHDPQWSDRYFGYGYANPQGLLNSDPSKFPDENPMFVTSLDDPRCNSEDGKSGYVDSDGLWVCEWSSGPFPEYVTAYSAVTSGKAQVLDSSNNLVDSVYSGDGTSHNKSVDASNHVTVWIVVGGIILIIALTLIVIFIASRSTKRITKKQSDAKRGVQQ
ncbi:S8 family serine peptidase [Leucobacter sp. NPDC058333]|uniref:S8 family peptidase n=1 Tax=Leucobacter sp. NPDC058333 TaxID=3346450 RepID=UPI00365A9DEC